MIYKFYTKTCGPCKKLSARLDSLGLTDKLEHIDVQGGLTELELARKYNVMSVPRLVVTKNDEMVESYDYSKLAKMQNNDLIMLVEKAQDNE